MFSEPPGVVELSEPSGFAQFFQEMNNPIWLRWTCPFFDKCPVYRFQNGKVINDDHLVITTRSNARWMQKRCECGSNGSSKQGTALQGKLCEARRFELHSSAKLCEARLFELRSSVKLCEARLFELPSSAKLCEAVRSQTVRIAQLREAVRSQTIRIAQLRETG